MIQGVAVRRSNICLWAASATLSWCQPRPEAWIWHDTVYCWNMPVPAWVFWLINQIADKQQLLYQGPGILWRLMQPLQVKSDFWTVVEYS